MAEKRVVLAEYFTSEDLTLLFIVREDLAEPHVISLEVSLNELRRCIADTFGSSADVRRQPDAETAEWNVQLAPLVAPVLDWTDPGDTIWFVPHDVLHYVPLHAVKLNGKFLIERNPVCYTPGASVMKFCQAKRRQRTGRAIVVGDTIGDLKHARAEAATVASLFDCSPIIGADATKSRLLSELDSDDSPLDVLHLACHGELDREQPLNSGIVLSPDSDQTSEGPASARLTAEQIFQLELNTNLVTLSACESGVNDRRPGDELIGLTRSLIYAGSPSVLVSLWAVDDFSTRLLMERFYENYCRTSDEPDTEMSKAEALQNALCTVMHLTSDKLRDWSNQQSQRDLSPVMDDETARPVADMSDSDHPFAHPYYWAAFSLIGDWK
jgi:CHAT domain-containing protein